MKCPTTSSTATFRDSEKGMDMARMEAREGQEHQARIGSFRCPQWSLSGCVCLEPSSHLVCASGHTLLLHVVFCLESGADKRFCLATAADEDTALRERLVIRRDRAKRLV